jgi:hypothetical protein
MGIHMSDAFSVSVYPDFRREVMPKTGGEDFVFEQEIAIFHFIDNGPRKNLGQ